MNKIVLILAVLLIMAGCVRNYHVYNFQYINGEQVKCDEGKKVPTYNRIDINVTADVPKKITTTTEAELDTSLY